MRGSDLDRRAVLRRLIAKLRADCVYYGVPEVRAERMSLEELIAERQRRLRALIEEAPKGAAWDA